MTLEEKKQFYRNLINFFKYQIGVDTIGILSRVSQTLSVNVLMNDPSQTKLNSNLQPERTRLQGEDYINVTNAWKDINKIIKIGKDSKFIEILTEILNELENENVKEV